MQLSWSREIRALAEQPRYTIHMKRTNLMLDEQLLESVMRELGAKTYSAAVNHSLAELLRVRKIQRLPTLYGKVLWEGDLAEMREDNPRKPKSGTAARKRSPASVR